MKIWDNYIGIKKENNLFMKHPDIAEGWHPTKNGSLQPQMFSPHSNKKVWWQCSNGHEWQTQVKVRSNGSGCRICARNISNK